MDNSASRGAEGHGGRLFDAIVSHQNHKDLFCMESAHLGHGNGRRSVDDFSGSRAEGGIGSHVFSGVLDRNSAVQMAMGSNTSDEGSGGDEGTHFFFLVGWLSRLLS